MDKIINAKVNNVPVKITVLDQPNEDGKSVLVNSSNVTSNANVIDIGEIIQDVSNIENGIKNSTPDKPWWTSKVILSNLGVLVVSATAFFGFNLSAHGVDINKIVGILAVILPIVNMYFRSKTNGNTQPIQSIIPQAITKLIRR